MWGLHDQNIAINQIKKPGTIASFAAKFYDERKIHFASAWDDGERGMLRKAHDLLSEADAVIGWNSSPFDVKWIKAQLLKHRFAPLKPFKQIDLLRTARSEFRLPSYKLDYVAQFLGIGSKIQTGGFDLWRGVMAKDEKAQRKMRRYNIGDVVLTEKVYDVLRPYVKNHPNVGVFDGHHCCPSCGGEKIQSRGHYVTRSRRYQQAQCRSCFTWLYVVNGVLQAGVQKLRAAA